MQNCPHCAEKISESARICKHCKRECLFELCVQDQLDDKQIYALAKFLVENPTVSFAPLNLRDARQALENSPFVFASGLNFQEVLDLEKKLPAVPVLRRLQTKEASSTEKSSYAAQLFYGTLSALLIALALYFFSKNNEPDSVELSLLEEAPSAIPKPHFEEKRSEATPFLSDSRPRELSREEILYLLDATVFIRGPQSIGSGFIISSDGFILSNSHVTSSMNEPIVTLRDGQQFKAQKIKEDPKLDISLLKIPSAGLSFLEMGDAHQLYPGQSVLTIGNPSGLSFTVTRGIVSFVGRELQGVQYIQTDAAINPGNSGGPMISHDLKVVGINTMTAKIEKGISFALPINYAYSKGGIAEGIGRYPSHAANFNVEKPVSLQTASLPQEDGPTLSADVYHQEVEGYRKRLEEYEKELLSRADDIKRKIEELKQQVAQSSSDLSKKSRLVDEIQALASKYSKIPNQVKDARIRYYRQVVSVLQRQKGDSRFSHLSDKIDAQIAELQSEKKKLEESLTP